MKDHELYHKVSNLCTELEKIKENLEDYDKSFRLKVDEKHEDLYDALWKATDELEEGLKEFAEACGLSPDERIYSPEELSRKQEYEQAISSREGALEYLRKCKVGTAVNVEFAEELAKACGRELSNQGLKVIEHKCRKLILALQLLKSLQEHST